MTLDERQLTDPCRRRKKCARSVIVGMAAVFALIAAPVDPFSNDQGVCWNVAFAGGGGNGGGGNGGGGNGGGGNGGGGGNAGGGGGNADGSTGGNAGDPAAVEANKGGGKKGVEVLLVEQGVSLAQFTTKISMRYPADNVSLHQAPHQAITFFSEVRGLAGHVVTHRWIYHGRVEYQTEFKIRGASWKSWSTQMLPAEKSGEWKVEVVDDNGTVLTERSLSYEPVEATAGQAGDG